MDYSIAASWRDFEQCTLTDVPAPIRKAMRRAFYAGASGVVGNIIDMIDGDDDSENFKPMIEIYAELVDFMHGLLTDEN